jgi:hypothetical protein
VHLGVSGFVARASRDACLLSKLGEKTNKWETETAEKELLLLWAHQTPTVQHPPERERERERASQVLYHLMTSQRVNV